MNLLLQLHPHKTGRRIDYYEPKNFTAKVIGLIGRPKHRNLTNIDRDTYKFIKDCIELEAVNWRIELV